METSQTKNIILFGKTGSGKSTIANILSGTSEFQESADLASCTTQCKNVKNYLFGDQKNVMAKIIDTPGFMDSSGTDNNTLEAIMSMLDSIKDNGFHIGLFCFSATETRCDGGILQALQMIQGLMTSDVLKHIVLVITQVNKLQSQYGQEQINRMIEQVPAILLESNIELNYGQTFVYQHKKRPNGLEALNEFIKAKTPFQPQICRDYVQNYVHGNPKQTQENLAKNSQMMQILLQMMSEMKESRELLVAQQKELTQRTIEAMSQQQKNTQEMLKEMRSAHAVQREELKRQKEQEMAALQADAEARMQVVEKNHQMMVDMMKASSAEEKKRTEALQASLTAMANRPPQVVHVPSGGGRGCFSYGTMIRKLEATGEETEIPIELVKVGDLVCSLDKNGRMIYDKVVIVDHNLNAPKFNVLMRHISYYDENISAEREIILTDHHHIYVSREQKVIRLASRKVQKGDYLLVRMDGEADAKFKEVIRIEDKPATKAVVNAVTLDSYNIIANNVHCSTHCDGDGDDMLFDVVNFCYHKISGKAPQVAFILQKGLKKLFRK